MDNAAPSAPLTSLLDMLDPGVKRESLENFHLSMVSEDLLASRVPLENKATKETEDQREIRALPAPEAEMEILGFLATLDPLDLLGLPVNLAWVETLLHRWLEDLTRRVAECR